MKGAVVVRIHAGLGNQMFQYAAGRALAARSGARLVLDTRYFGAGRRPYGLHHFNIRHAEDPQALPPRRECLGVRHFLWKRLGLTPRLVAERSLAFDERLLSPGADVYLDGYWQSERYFEDALETIREDFRIVTPPDRENARLMEKIEGSRAAVSLHVRRGDYLLPENQAVQGSCSLDYYARALEFVASRMEEEPVVHVFSDDPGWVRQNLRLPFETRAIGHNGPERNYEDLRLISACRHHVIANSTFSWWGAWLGRAPDKIVAAPKRWFANPGFHNPDITPPSWHKIDA